MSPTRNETFEFVTEAHAGQFDKAGEPYVGHLVRVEGYAVEIGREAGLDALALDRVRRVALLHDLIEDTGRNVDDLKNRGYDEADVKSVKLLTKDPVLKLPYAQVIQGIADSGDVVAIVVKLGDNKDNGDEKRLAQLPEDKAARLRKKYVPARAVLREALANLAYAPINPSR